MNKIKPRVLQKGDTIGIVCPSYANTMKQREHKFYRFLEEAGFKVKIGKSCTLQDGYLADRT